MNRVNEYILNPLIILMFVVALLVFFWGLAEFIYKTGNGEGDLEKGKNNMIYGILGMCIMVAVYGIIRVILATFGLDAPAYIAPSL